jgi:predicted permease
MRALWRRFRALFAGKRLDRELDEEVRVHLEMLADDFRERGMSPRAAREAARREFGGIERMKEAYRDRRGLPFLEILAKDARYAIRGLRRNPAFTIAAVTSLALGIGANTAIFSFINTLMLRMLPVDRPEQLVSLFKTGGWGRGYASYPLYLEFRKHTELFTGVLARSGDWKVRFDTPQNTRAEFIRSEFVSGNYFDLLGVKPALGRLFHEEDNGAPRGHPLVVLSYDFWRSRFGLDPGVLGRLIRVDEQPLTVIGVAAPGFRGVEVEHHPDVWVPAIMYRGNIMDPGMHWVWIIARRRTGVPAGRIQAAANTIMQGYLRSVYGDKPYNSFRRWAMEQRIEVSDGGVGISLLREQFGKPLAVLMAVVGLVLLIACANVANLLIARGAARRREIALRFSLSATRSRVIHQSLIESLLLALLGSVPGLIFAILAGRYMLLFLPADSSGTLNIVPAAAVLAFTAGISIISALLFGLAPALRAAALDPAAALKDSGSPALRGGLHVGLRKALVVAQVALSAVLVVAAGLFTHSLAQLRSINPGFRYQNVLTFHISYPAAWKEPRKDRLRENLLMRVAALPGVVSYSYGAPGPYQGGSWSAGIRVPGSARTARSGVEVSMQGIGAGYFETIGSRPLRGSEFSESDLRSGRKIALVNEAFVREFLPGTLDPVGRVLSFDDGKPEGGEPTYIVGFVRDILHKGLKVKPEATVYVPFHRDEISFDPALLVRARIAPNALLPMIRRELNSLGPELALVEPRTIRERVDDSIFLDRMVATLSGSFGLLALLLAAVGIFGVMAYAVVRRTAEIGLRIALGAGTAGIKWMILRDALLLIGSGIATGLPISIVAAKLTSSLLYGIDPSDPVTFALTISVLLGAGTFAAYVPACRAARIEPTQALRHE